ncbi:TonB-dependent siderophore receptor [Chryseobacterium rhizosphaerae]|uniref:Iron complex outermembrane receptor protein n=3 Tax=Chryseobacterium TaxID=59732 RepID=A0AAE3Y850_9FLAO|nr:TonB-dependent receptor [Chryseobacterium rhizosphaerae]MDR6525792.1 iron complex outermembrane receptor protein [Chryseobacterium rhizosphaerae]MDR6545020.1 iron complex outermembrane receptor protein [Chryseobacterium rhizosphaerae]
MKRTIISAALLAVSILSAQEKDTVKIAEIQAVSLQGTHNYRTKKSESVARLPLENLENPTVYNLVPKEIISEMSAVDFNTAMASAPGVVVNNSVNDSGNDIFLRGFSSSANFRNGLIQNPRVQSEIANVERIEVIKGPSGTLFGGTLANYGGVVNVVTKKPQENFGGIINYTTGSWGMNRITADINTPLNKEKTALARFNVAAYSQDSFQDAGYNKGLFFSGSILYKVSDKTTVTLDTEFHSPEKTLNAYVRQSEKLTLHSMKDLAAIHGRSFTSNDIGSKRTNFVTMAEVTHKFNDQWTSRTSYQRGEANENESIFLVLNYLNDNSVSRSIRPFDNYKITTDNIQQNFIGDFKIGKLRNRLVVGFDYFHQNSKNQYPVYKVGKNDSSVFVPYPLNGVIVDKDQPQPTDVVLLNGTSDWTSISRDVVKALPRNGTKYEISQYSTYSAYVSDVLNITDNFLVMASLRMDHYKNDDIKRNGVPGNDGYNQTQFSPKFGLVYEIKKDEISFFANYVNGFKNIAPSANQDGILTKWDPEQGNQFEAGFKLDLFGKKLLSTITYYNMKVKNRVIADPGGLGSRQDGNIKNQGFEMDVVINPVKGWNIVGGYGYNDNRYDDRGKDAGKRIAWTPKHVANLWTSYKIMDGAYEGLGFGAGFNFVDKTYINITNHFLAPSYTSVGATIFYDKKKYRIGLKMNNALNETYWNFYGQPQKPREVLANFAFKF